MNYQQLLVYEIVTQVLLLKTRGMLYKFMTWHSYMHFRKLYGKKQLLYISSSSHIDRNNKNNTDIHTTLYTVNDGFKHLLKGHTIQ